jgi:hypothetical protein
MEVRDEIVPSQKARIDLFKWKIILAASLGAIALGLENAAEIKGKGEAPSGAHAYVLLLIPLVCLYVDLLCSHLTLRINVIGCYYQYVKRAGKVASHDDYEAFVERTRHLTQEMVQDGRKVMDADGGFDVFSFQNLPQHLSTRVLSVMVLLWGLPAAVRSYCDFQMPGLRPASPGDESGGWAFVVAGLTGITVSFLANCQYRRRDAALHGLVAKLVREETEQPPANVPIA